MSASETKLPAPGDSDCAGLGWIPVSTQGFFDQSQICSPDLPEHNSRERMALTTGLQKGKAMALLTSRSLGSMHSCGNSQRTDFFRVSRAHTGAKPDSLYVRRASVASLSTSPYTVLSLKPISCLHCTYTSSYHCFSKEANLRVASNCLV